MGDGAGSSGGRVSLRSSGRVRPLRALVLLQSFGGRDRSIRVVLGFIGIPADVLALRGRLALGVRGRVEWGLRWDVLRAEAEGRQREGRSDARGRDRDPGLLDLPVEGADKSDWDAFSVVSCGVKVSLILPSCGRPLALRSSQPLCPKHSGVFLLTPVTLLCSFLQPRNRSDGDGARRRLVVRLSEDGRCAPERQHQGHVVRPLVLHLATCEVGLALSERYGADGAWLSGLVGATGSRKTTMPKYLFRGSSSPLRPPVRAHEHRGLTTFLLRCTSG